MKRILLLPWLDVGIIPDNVVNTKKKKNKIPEASAPKKKHLTRLPIHLYFCSLSIYHCYYCSFILISTHGFLTGIVSSRITILMEFVPSNFLHPSSFHFGFLYFLVDSRSTRYYQQFLWTKIILILIFIFFIDDPTIDTVSISSILCILPSYVFRYDFPITIFDTVYKSSSSFFDYPSLIPKKIGW